ncbi:MAG: DUF58 domain-containing protein [Clostridia bacterium]|nr:DUF58 domain-containing protein [Clostridia bacterium]
MAVAWLIFFTFVFLIVQGKVYKKRVFKNLDYNRFFSASSVYAGENVEMVEIISNHKLLPVFWLRLESKISKYLEFEKQSNLNIEHQQYHRSLFSLMPYTKITRRHKIRCLKRGFYQLSSAAMTSGDPLGIHQVYKDISLSSELLVYPKIISTDDIDLPTHSWQGDLVVRRWIVDDPFMVSGVREYHYGDPLNRINWKATAKAGRLQVHNTDYTANTKLLVLLNIESTEDSWDSLSDPDLAEKGISYASSIAYSAITKGIETGFGCNGYLLGQEKAPVFIYPSCSTEHWIGLLEVMAKLVIERAVTFHTFLDEAMEMRNVDILIITPFINERLENKIEKMKASGNAVEILHLGHFPGEEEIR